MVVPETFKISYEKGVKLLDEGKSEEALESFEGASIIAGSAPNYDKAQVYLHIALCHMKMGDKNKAKQNLKLSLGLDSTVATTLSQTSEFDALDDEMDQILKAQAKPATLIVIGLLYIFISVGGILSILNDHHYFDTYRDFDSNFVFADIYGFLMFAYIFVSAGLLLLGKSIARTLMVLGVPLLYIAAIFITEEKLYDSIPWAAVHSFMVLYFLNKVHVRIYLIFGPKGPDKRKLEEYFKYKKSLNKS